MDVTPVHPGARTRCKLSRRRLSGGGSVSGSSRADLKRARDPSLTPDSCAGTPVKRLDMKSPLAGGFPSPGCWDSPAEGADSDSHVFDTSSPLIGGQSQQCVVVWRDETACRLAEDVKRRARDDDEDMTASLSRRPPVPSPLVPPPPPATARQPSRQQREQLLQMLATAEAAAATCTSSICISSTTRTSSSTSTSSRDRRTNAAVNVILSDEDDDILSQIAEEDMCGRGSVSVVNNSSSNNRGGAVTAVDSAVAVSQRPHSIAPITKISCERTGKTAVVSAHVQPVCSVMSSSNSVISPSRKAIINRRRAEALRKLRQKQRMRSAIQAILPGG